MQDEFQNTSAQDPLNLAKDSPVYEPAQEFQAQNVILRARRLELELNLANLTTEREVLRRANRILNERYASAQRVVEFANRSDDLGRVLIAFWEELNRLRLLAPRHGISRLVGDTGMSRSHRRRTISAVFSVGTDPTVVRSDVGHHLVDF